MALTSEQVDNIRTAVSEWRRGPGIVGPPPDGQLEHVIEVMLGTSARIGEVLAIRKCDVDVTGSRGHRTDLRDDRLSERPSDTPPAAPQDEVLNARARGFARTWPLKLSEPAPKAGSAGDGEANRPVTGATIM